MTKQEAAILACRVLSLYFIAQAAITSATSLIVLSLSMLLASPSEWKNSFQIHMVLGMFLPMLVQLLIGLILWRLAPAIARKLMPEGI